MAPSAPGVGTEVRDGLRWWQVPALCCSIRGIRQKAVGAGGGGRKERSMQGPKPQLPKRAVTNQELKLRISPGVPELVI